MRSLLLPAACAALLFAGAAFARTGTLTFSNQSAAAGIVHTYVPGSFSNSEYMGPGACGDFDEDGDPDLFLPSGGGVSGAAKVYLNQGDGTFSNGAAAWGITAVYRGTCVAVGDYDNDGYLDVFEGSNGTSGAGQAGQNKLYRNVGGASFNNVAAAAGVPGTSVDPFGASFGDYDLDGDADLLIGGFNSHATRLYRNNGNGTFNDVTAAMGVAAPISLVYTFATRFCDTNGDRYPEILISGDFGTSRYLRNNSGNSFTNWTVPSGTAKDENGMGGTIGDFNRDGKIDWYVTSIHSVNVPNWTGNKLYQNQGGHVFSEVSAAAGVGDGGYGWGAVGVDFNHDRWLDIGETNGAQWSAEWVNERSYVWLNQGNGTYVESSAASGLNHLKQGRGMLNFDYDLDGDQDLLFVANNQATELWRNDLTGTDIHWLRVKLDTFGYAGFAPEGLGSLVRVTAGGVTQTGHVFGGDNLQSQSELTAHFGLGAETLVTELKVEWANGAITRLRNVAVDQTITITPSFTDLAGGIAGTAGPLTLSGQGTLIAGAPTTIALEGAVPSAPGVLFIGTSAINAPMLGGTFVPAPAILLPFSASPSGTLLFPGIPWPAGLPSGFSLWFQAWFSDAGAIHGASASNGMKAETP